MILIALLCSSIVSLTQATPIPTADILATISAVVGPIAGLCVILLFIWGIMRSRCTYPCTQCLLKRDTPCRNRCLYCLRKTGFVKHKDKPSVKVPDDMIQLLPTGILSVKPQVENFDHLEKVKITYKFSRRNGSSQHARRIDINSEMGGETTSLLGNLPYEAISTYSNEEQFLGTRIAGLKILTVRASDGWYTHRCQAILPDIHGPSENITPDEGIPPPAIEEELGEGNGSDEGSSSQHNARSDDEREENVNSQEVTDGDVYITASSFQGQTQDPPIELGSGWKLKYIDGFKSARGIAADKNGNFVVTDTMEKDVILYKADDKVQNSFKKIPLLHILSWGFVPHVLDPDGIQMHKFDPLDVCVTSRDQAIVIMEPTIQKGFVAIDFGGQKQYRFPSSCAKNEWYPQCLTQDLENGLIYAGFMTKIFVYSAADFSFKKEIPTEEKPCFIACTKDHDDTNRKLLITDNKGVVQAYNLDGKQLITNFKPFLNESAVNAFGVAYDNDGNVYLGLGPMGENKSHIHKYSMTSTPPYLAFQECVAKGLYQPQGMDYTNGCLYVANTDTVLIFSQTM